MKNSRFLADYGMVLVLLLLCAFFSVVTMKEQWPSGEAGARQVVESINEKYSKTARVIVVASTQSGDPEFADAFEREFTAAGGKVLAVVKGDPKDARESLAKLNAAGERWMPSHPHASLPRHGRCLRTSRPIFPRSANHALCHPLATSGPIF